MRFLKHILRLMIFMSLAVACSQKKNSEDGGPVKNGAQTLAEKKSLDVTFKLVEDLISGTSVSLEDLMFVKEPAVYKNLGFMMCLDSGHEERFCKTLQGEPNHMAYGICLAGNRSKKDCDPILKATTGQKSYAICMTSGLSKKKCDDVFDSEGQQLGFGLCMAAGRRKIDCDNSLKISGSHIGFGLCMAAGKKKKDCEDALDQTVDNIGYGLCLAHVIKEKNCENSEEKNCGNIKKKICDKALGSENLDFGLCLQSGNSLKICETTLDK